MRAACFIYDRNSPAKFERIKSESKGNVSRFYFKLMRDVTPVCAFLHSHFAVRSNPLARTK